MARSKRLIRRTIDSDLFKIQFIPIGDRSTKISVLAGLKVSKKAVVRNKIKRRAREIIRLNLSNEIRRGYFIVASAKPEAADKEFSRLKEDLLNALKKINPHTK